MTGFFAYTGIGYEVDHDAAWDYIHNGYLLAPRTVLKGWTKVTATTLPAVSVELRDIPSVLQETLQVSMGKIAGSHRAVMFSGGFDSMLIALLAQQCGAQVTAVTIQFDDFNPLTMAGSIQFANKMRIAHHILHVKDVEFLSAFEALAGLTDEPLLDLDLAVVYAAFKKYDSQIGGDVFISGMGSDQWFGNEALGVKPGGLTACINKVNVDEDAHQRVAQVHGCKFVFPFLSEPMMVLSQSVPSAMKKDKKLLRGLAIAKMIPHQGIRNEVQVPALMRHILIKTYGHRAWPCPVSVQSKIRGGYEQALRQIILGLWLEKVKDKRAFD